MKNLAGGIGGADTGERSPGWASVAYAEEHPASHPDEDGQAARWGEWQQDRLPAATTENNSSQADLATERENFLACILGGLDGVLCLSQFNPKLTNYWPSNIADMAKLAGELQGNVYYNCATRKNVLPDNARGGVEDCCQTRILWVDLDVLGPNHAGQSLPPDYESALTLLRSFPVHPSYVVDSGGGLQAGWLLEKPMDRDAALAFLPKWKVTWDYLGDREGKAAGYAGGWSVDNVFNLDRMMRMPNTINAKNGKMARLLEKHWDGLTTLSDLEPYLHEAAPKPHRAELLPRAPESGELPGDIYNAQVSITDLLLREGFTVGYSQGGDQHWYRPGKSKGETSATIYRSEPDKVTIWSSTCKEWWPALETRRPYDSFGLYTVIHHEGEHSAACKALWEDGYRPVRGTPQLTVPERAIERQFTDLGNAQRLVDQFGEDLRFVPKWSRWLRWDGSRWADDDLNTPYYYATLVAKKIWDTAFADPKLLAFARHAQSRNGIESMVSLARSDRRVVVSVDDLDSHAELLAVANGTLDLRTGILRAPDRRDLITKGSDVAYHPDATCPTWLAFLEKVQPSPAVRVFLQRAIGYSLTGCVNEEKLFFMFGLGANGKSVLAVTLGKLLGPYAGPVPENFLTSANQPAHVMADIFGMRVIFANETSADGTINEQRLKQIASYEQLNACHKYGHPFDFVPTCKLWVRGNYHPRVAGTDEGIWRRLDLINFGVHIPEAEQDKNFAERLEVELPGILAWAVRGAVDWYAGGLAEPPEVVRATQEYRASEDVLGKFLDSECRFGDGLQATATDLNARLEAYCRGEGIGLPSARALATRLRQRGLQSRRSNGSNWWRGVGVLSYEDGPEPPGGGQNDPHCEETADEQLF